LPEALSGRQLERDEGVADVAHVEIGMPVNDLLRLAPESLVSDSPGLLLGHALDRTHGGIIPRHGPGPMGLRTYRHFRQVRGSAW
jgi:hypothetical protein